MITRIEALRYRCLEYVSQPLGPFHVLVGPNASGKTTFLDVVAFLGRLVADGVDAAVSERSQNPYDLIWGHSGKSFELAIEARIPDRLRNLLADKIFDTFRYEISLEIREDALGVEIVSERGLLKTSESVIRSKQRRLFPGRALSPATIQTASRTKSVRTVIAKIDKGNDNFYSETYEKRGKGWVPTFRLGSKRSALGNLPEDESKFPVATWLKEFLSIGVQQLTLNSLLLRRASPPGSGKAFKSDGSNLPWVVSRLEKEAPERLSSWIEHLATALPDLEGIRTVERGEDRHRYLKLKYKGGFEIPSWMASDGTLRMLALTIPAYLEELSGIYLIEEPENGIHPRAVETVFQSLSSVYDAQVLLATHSPVVLGIVELKDLLCFAKIASGGTDIVSGIEHPALRDWREEASLGVLFAAGVLG